MFRIERIQNSDTWVVKDCLETGYPNEDVWYLSTCGLECLKDAITATLQEHDITSSNYLKTKGEIQ